MTITITTTTLTAMQIMDILNEDPAGMFFLPLLLSLLAAFSPTESLRVKKECFPLKIYNTTPFLSREHKR